MTDEAPPSTSSPSSFTWKSIGLIFLILIVLIGLSTSFVWGYIEWNRLQTTLSAQGRDLQNMSETYQTTTEKLQKNIESLEQKLQQSQTLLAEQAQILKQIEGVQKGEFDIWRGMSAAYLVKLANDQVMFTHDASNVLPLLQRAIEVLQGAHDLTLIKIQQSLRADVVRFKAIPIINLTVLYDQLIDLNQQLDKLPLRQLNQINTTSQASTPATSEPDIKKEALPWWKAGWYHSLNLLKKIIIIHRQEGSTLPFILPQDTTLFYQSLHAHLQNAIWGLLHQSPNIYTTSLSQLIMWIEKYCDMTTLPAQNMVSRLQALKNQSIQPTTENLTATVAEFDQYFAMQNNNPPLTP